MLGPEYFYHLMTVGCKNVNTPGICSIIGSLDAVWQDFVSGSETPGANEEFRLGKRLHCRES
jgi:hypothetical protein